MLNIFPDLLTYKMYAPFILRVVVGVIFLELGYLKLGKEKAAWKMFFETIHLKPAHLFVSLFATIEIVFGSFLIFGYFTQIAALVMAIVLFAEAYIEMRDGTLIKRDIIFYTLLLVICVSLLFSGAGKYAMDIPL